MFPQYTPRVLGCFNKINSKIKSTQMYKAETVFKVNTVGKMLLGLKSSLDEVSPLDETALARQFEFSALRRLETSQLRPMITGPTESQDRRGMKLQRSYHRDREFPRSPEGAKAPRGQVLEI